MCSRLAAGSFRTLARSINNSKTLNFISGGVSSFSWFFSSTRNIYFLALTTTECNVTLQAVLFYLKKGGMGNEKRVMLSLTSERDGTTLCILVSKYSICFCLFFFSVNRRKAVPVLMGGMSMAIRSFRWTHPPLPQTHGSQTVQVRSLRAQFLALRSLGPPPQTSSMKKDATLFGCFCTLRLCVFLSFC